MVRLLHGTSADNLQSILKRGIQPGVPNWEVSSRSHVYFWNPLCMEDFDEYDYQYQEAFRRAAESAEFCLYNANDCRRLVVEVELQDCEFWPDTSCNNMEEAVCANPVPADKIVAIYRDREDLSYYKPYFGSLRLERYMAEEVDLSVAQLKISQLILKSSDVVCEIFETLSDLSYDMERVL